MKVTNPQVEAVDNDRQWQDILATHLAMPRSICQSLIQHFRPFARICTICLLLTLTIGCAASATEPTDGPYSYKTPSSDGIGKVYYGREIAEVMGYQGANWLARPSRTTEERSDMAVDALMLERDDVVADIGAGLGYISFQLAHWVDDRESDCS